MKRTRPYSCRSSPLWLGLCATLYFLGHGMAPAQVNSGASFLKLLPGARHQGMATTITGAIDDMHALYANPAATGFLREWQWSTTYTEWIADSYQLSLNYARGVRHPLSKKTRFALGLQYQGIREFDSTNRNQPAASASDFMLALSAGQPLSLFNKDISLGANAKFFRSGLADFNASTWAFDLGVLYRSRRFEIDLPFFDYGILSAGASLSNLGKPLTFISSATPLPRTFRMGASLNVGSHKGLQFQLSTDLKKTRDEGAHFSIGSEMSWSYRLSVRSGYNFNSRFLNKFTFGFSLRLDDHASPISSMPGRNKAMRVDFAGIEKKEVFQTTYQASVNYFPTRPEAFELAGPLHGHNINGEQVEFVWTAAQDPDLYDEVGYIFLLERLQRDTSVTQLRQHLQQADSLKTLQLRDLVAGMTPGLVFAGEVTNEITERAGKVHYLRKALPAGEYNWSVIAFDQDHHFRLADNNDSPVGRFKVMPDLYITDFRFTPSPWITDSDYQGELSMTIANQGKAPAEDVLIAVRDSLHTVSQAVSSKHHIASSENGKSNGAANGMTPNSRIAHELKISQLHPNTDTTLTVPWHTPLHGIHRLAVHIDPLDDLQEYDERNNTESGDFYTIPRGVFVTQEKVVTQIDSLYEYELPFIPKIYFDHGSVELDNLGSSLTYSPLRVLARRFKHSRNLYLNLRGFVDLENGEPASLATERAQAVKRELVRLGIDESAINIMSEKQAETRFKQSDAVSHRDQRWVAEERRYVQISVRDQNASRENVQLFYSVPVKLPKSKTFLPVELSSTITGFLPVQSGEYVVSSDSSREISFEFAYAGHDTLSMIWTLNEHQRQALQNSRVAYYAEMTDSQGRTFRTRPAKTFLATEKRNLLDHKILIGVAEFRQKQPGVNLYWDNVARKVRNRLRAEDIRQLNFVGHACAIGDTAYNYDLSLIRAQNFYQEFDRRFPALMQSITSEVDTIRVFGEGESRSFSMQVDRRLFLETLRKHNLDEFNYITYELVSSKKYNRGFPFTFRLAGDVIVIESDNNTPFGRQINRRIEIQLDAVQKHYPRLSRTQ